MGWHIFIGRLSFWSELEERGWAGEVCAMADAMLKILNNNGTIRIFSDKATGQNAPGHRGCHVQAKSEPDGRPGLVEEGEAGH